MVFFRLDLSDSGLSLIFGLPDAGYSFLDLVWHMQGFLSLGGNCRYSELFPSPPAQLPPCGRSTVKTFIPIQDTTILKMIEYFVYIII